MDVFLRANERFIELTVTPAQAGIQFIFRYSAILDARPTPSRGQALRGHDVARYKK